jgi:hypothetical protein
LFEVTIIILIDITWGGEGKNDSPMFFIPKAASRLEQSAVTYSAGFCSTRGVGSDSTARIAAN